jgi:hypothetical protein
MTVVNSVVACRPALGSYENMKRRRRAAMSALRFASLEFLEVVRIYTGQVFNKTHETNAERQSEFI